MNDFTERESEGITAAVDAVFSGALSGTLGVTRAHVGDVPVVVLTVHDGQSAYPMAVLLIDDTVDLLTFPSEAGVSPNPHYDGAPV